MYTEERGGEWGERERESESNRERGERGERGGRVIYRDAYMYVCL